MSFLWLERACYLKTVTTGLLHWNQDLPKPVSRPQGRLKHGNFSSTSHVTRTCLAMPSCINTHERTGFDRTAELWAGSWEELTPTIPVRCCDCQELHFSFSINSPHALPQHLFLSFLDSIQKPLQFPSSLVVHKLLPNASVEAPGELPQNRRKLYGTQQLIKPAIKNVMPEKTGQEWPPNIWN